MKIVLISCASKKLNKKARAQDLYISQLFKSGLKYAKSLNPDKIFILSAKYGLLNLEQEVEPYNETLNNLSDKEIKAWSKKVLTSLSKEADLENDEFIFLAGEKYRRYLIPVIKHFQVPMQGLGIGKQLAFLKNKESMCNKLHNLFNNMKIFNFPFNEKELPLNGIYIVFEKREKGHGLNRIVRIGTHTGGNQLRSRLVQHFVNENKDRSIFRKNIGRALVRKEKIPYEEMWEQDLTTREAREKFSVLVDIKKQKQIEKQVSKYIQDNFSFVVILVEDKDKRLELESKIISTISLCKECKASPDWLGNFSPKEKIRDSGLWLVNELGKNSLSEAEFEELERICKS